MNFFNDDPFEEMIREFFGSNFQDKEDSETIIGGEEEDRVIDFVEDDNKVYLVFELPGYNEKDVVITIKNRELEIKVQKLEKDVQDYLMQKLGGGLIIKKTLPKFINPNKFSHTIKNGILEIAFNKKKWNQINKKLLN